MYLKNLFFTAIFMLTTIVCTPCVQVSASEKQVGFYIVDQEHLKGKTFGVLIQDERFRLSIMQSCLLTVDLSGDDGKPKFLSPRELIDFFTVQGIVPHIEAPKTDTPGQTKTYAHTWGVEFDSHGPIENKVEGLIRTLLDDIAPTTDQMNDGRINKSSINFTDFGAGYGSFALHLLAQFTGEQVHVDLSEALSVQCYHAAQKLKEFPNVRIFPSCVFTHMLYGGTMDTTYDLSTCLNVFHFMQPDKLNWAIKTIFNLTNSGGYHIAVAYSPYSGTEDTPSKRAGYCEGWQNVGGIDSRDSFYFFDEITFRTQFGKAGFDVKETGCFGISDAEPSRFCYVIAQKPVESDATDSLMH